MVDCIAPDYWERLRDRTPLPDVQPQYLRQLMIALLGALSQTPAKFGSNEFLYMPPFCKNAQKSHKTRIGLVPIQIQLTSKWPQI